MARPVNSSELLAEAEAGQEGVVVKCPKCGEYVSFWRLSPTTLCPACLEARKREDEVRKRDQDQALQEHSQQFTQRQRERKCPCCGSEALGEGALSGFKFSVRMEGFSSWLFPHEVQVFVCLDCGFVGQFVFWDPAFGKARLGKRGKGESAEGV
jgi:hypothetical protein